MSNNIFKKVPRNALLMKDALSKNLKVDQDFYNRCKNIDPNDFKTPYNTRTWLTGFFENPLIRIGNSSNKLCDLIGNWLFEYSNEYDIKTATDNFIDIFDYQNMTVSHYVILSGVKIENEINLNDKISIIPFKNIQNNPTTITEQVISHIKYQLKNGFLHRYAPTPVGRETLVDITKLLNDLSVLKIKKALPVTDIFRLKSEEKLGSGYETNQGTFTFYPDLANFDPFNGTSGILHPHSYLPCGSFLVDKDKINDILNTVNYFSLLLDRTLIYADQWLEIEEPVIWGTTLNYYIPSKNTASLSKGLYGIQEYNEIENFEFRKSIFEKLSEDDQDTIKVSNKLYLNSCREDVLNNKILYLASSFDRLLVFVPNKISRNNTKTIALRGACVLGNTIQDKQVIYDKLFALYKLRSELFHKGTSDIKNQTDLYLLCQSYWKEIISIFLEKKQIPNWIKLDIIIPSNKKNYGFEEVKKDGVFQKNIFGRA